jgi:phage anti-repressor protein
MNFHPTNDYPINLDDVFGLIGFANKGNAMKLIKNNFVENEDYKISFFRSEKRKKEGGHDNQKTTLNIDTFKNLCMIAKTEKGKEIRKYYVKLENIYNELIKEELNEKEHLLNKKDQELIEKNHELIEKDSKHFNDMKVDKHMFLINKFNYKRCIYIGEIKYNNQLFYKIGSSENIHKRSDDHKKSYGNFIYVDVFECSDFRNIEKDILNDNLIKSNLYYNEINGHHSIECVLLHNLFNYDQLVNIVISYIERIKFFTNEQLLENKKLDFEKQKLEYDLISKLLDNDKYHDFIKQKLESLHFKPILEKQIEKSKFH